MRFRRDPILLAQKGEYHYTSKLDNPHMRKTRLNFNHRRIQSDLGSGFGFDTYLSVFSWRYGSREMRRIFSEKRYRALWRKIWVELASAQSDFGLVRKEEVEALREKSDESHVDIARAHEIEKEIKHDLMAELMTFAEQVPSAGGRLHLGATSADIEDNADILRMKEALEIITSKLVRCLDALRTGIEKYKDTPCMGWTHLQPAEPTVLGYRLANYAQELALDLAFVNFILKEVLKGKGLKGAVGTYASYKNLLAGKGEPSLLEERFMGSLSLNYFPVSTQTYPRKVDYLVLTALASIAQSCHKFAMDIRILQSPPFGELAEPWREKQVGSSTMPFKRNPITAERICSLARIVASLPNIALSNASTAILERTLDDSASRRVIIPEAFLATDECLTLYEKVAKELRVFPNMMKRNLKRYGIFSGTEALMVKLAALGYDRQEAHEKIRRLSMIAWEEVSKEGNNPLPNLIKEDEEISKRLSHKEVDEILNPFAYLGDAKERCELFLTKVLLPILLAHKDGLKMEGEGEKEGEGRKRKVVGGEEEKEERRCITF